MVLLRGALLLLVALIGLSTFSSDLPAFSWLIETILPAILIISLVIFAPEIRQALERLGRAIAISTVDKSVRDVESTINAIVYSAIRLSNRKHGALIILKRRDVLDEYIKTGAILDAVVTPELLLQIFYPNTPLHDGAVIISNSRLLAASCVMPLSASGVLTESPERQMGLRHRAALGISEVTDAIAVVISEETGSITIANSGKMIRRINSKQLRSNLEAYFMPQQTSRFEKFFSRLMPAREEKDLKNE
jgi:diadenylate cyclase